MNYILIDNVSKTQKRVSEKDLRDIYFKNMENIIYNWKDCGDEKLVKGLKKEKEEVYTTNIKNVIKRILEDNWFYEIKEIDFMKIEYEQTYVPYVDITIIMKAIYDENNEQVKYVLSGYYFGKPSLDGLETFKDNKGE